jgi:hypothetical protein
MREGVEPPPEEIELRPLSANQEDNFTILENGDAVMELSTTVPSSPLANLYVNAFENTGEAAFKAMFHEGIQKGYQTLIGINVSIVDSQIQVGPIRTFGLGANGFGLLQVPCPSRSR